MNLSGPRSVEGGRGLRKFGGVWSWGLTCSETQNLVSKSECLAGRGECLAGRGSMVQ